MKTVLQNREDISFVFNLIMKLIYEKHTIR